MQIVEILKPKEERWTEMPDFTNNRNLTEISKKTSRDQCSIWSKESNREVMQTRDLCDALQKSEGSNKLGMTQLLKYLLQQDYQYTQITHSHKQKKPHSQEKKIYHCNFSKGSFVTMKMLAIKATAKRTECKYHENF